jgi:hypothetical protein
MTRKQKGQWQPSVFVNTGLKKKVWKSQRKQNFNKILLHAHKKIGKDETHNMNNLLANLLSIINSADRKKAEARKREKRKW